MSDAVRYDLRATVRGSLSRPSYTGSLRVVVRHADNGDPSEEIRRAAHRELRRTSFPEIWLDSVTVHSSTRVD